MDALAIEDLSNLAFCNRWTGSNSIGNSSSWLPGHIVLGTDTIDRKTWHRNNHQKSRLDLRPLASDATQVYLNDARRITV